MRRFFRLSVPPAFFALIVSSCAWLSGDPSAATARHVILVTIDTLRADRLGCYGNRQVATPNLDRLAQEGAMAPDATVHVPLTRPSHVSLLTGLLPSEHGIRDNVSPPLDPEVPLLADVLKAAGFRTAAFVSSVVLTAQSGLDRGFDLYSDDFEEAGDDPGALNTVQKRGDITTDEAVAWLESNRGADRLFAWIHLFDPHDPYEPPEPYASEYAGRLYDGEVAWSDELIGRLDASLEQLGLRDDTLLVVTSDHGEGLGEHGEELHGFFVYQSTLAVPLLFRGPGVVPGARIGATARIVDLFPTILEMTGVGAAAKLQLSGRSLAGALRGEEELSEQTSYAETLYPLLHFGWSDLRCLREGGWKYIEAPKPELYDLEHDPGETRNLVRSEPSRAEALRSKLAVSLEEEQARLGTAPRADGMPLDLLEKLGALGYLGSSGSTTKSPGADPKDKLEDFRLADRLTREGLALFREKDFAGSIDRFQDLLGLIDSFEVHYYLGRALLGSKRYKEAATHLERAIEYQPSFAAPYESLAECRAEAGDLEGALAAVRQGQSAHPGDVSLLEREAWVWSQMGKPHEARRAFEAALPLAPDDALLRAQLGELLRDLGDLDQAVGRLREAVALDPEEASYWYSLGTVLGGRNELTEAEKAFREAWKRDESNPEYSYSLGLALLSQGKTEEAGRYFQATLQLDPKFEAARIRLADAAYDQGRRFEASGQPEKAGEQYLRALSYQPRMLHARFSLGRLLLQSGKTEEGRALLRGYEQFRVWEKKVRLLLPEVTQGSLSTTAGREKALALVALFLEGGALEDASKLIYMALLANPGDPALLTAQARYLLLSGQPQKARVAVEPLLSLPDPPADALELSAELYVLENNLVDAIDLYHRLLDTHPDPPAALLTKLATAYASNEQTAKAESYFRRALEKDPRLAEAHTGLGSILASAQRLEEAEKSFRRALEIDPELLTAQQKVSALLLSSGRTEEAERLLRWSVLTNPADAVLRRNLAQALQSLGREEEAKEEIAKARQIEAWQSPQRN